MSLPNPSMSFSPFAILTAEEMNDLVENIEALSAGTGLEDDSISGAKLDYDNIPVMNFSSSEVDTGKNWIDGRPIYRKVIGGVVNLTVGNGTIATGITGLGSNPAMLSIGGYIRLSNGTDTGSGTQTLPVYRESSQFLSFRGFDGSSIAWTGTFAWGNSYYRAVLEYVK